MSVYSVDGYFVEDGDAFYGYLVTEQGDAPEGYSDEQIFFYGVKPEVGKQYDDFVVTNVREIE